MDHDSPWSIATKYDFRRFREKGTYRTVRINPLTITAIFDEEDKSHTVHLSCGTVVHVVDQNGISGISDWGFEDPE